MRPARKDAFVATAALLLMLAVLLPFVWWISTDEQRVQYRCRRFDTTAFFDSRYPGGIDRFEKDWLNWLKIGRPAGVSL